MVPGNLLFGLGRLFNCHLAFAVSRGMSLSGLFIWATQGPNRTQSNGHIG